MLRLTSSPLRKNASNINMDPGEADTLLASQNQASDQASISSSKNLNNSMIKNFDNIIMKPIFGGKIKVRRSEGRLEAGAKQG